MAENEIKTIPGLSKADFISDQMVKWCPGCGDHAILSSFQKVLPQVGVRKEDVVVVSGIGCSSRFPYYVKTYGFHGIHGRAAALASGIKISNPDLMVWMITGDGDSLAIGGNHFIHVLRRNLDINIMLFNNMIYGLTKGQFSPTTPSGFKTKTSPQGTIEHPFNVGELAIGAQGTFFARAVDTNPKMMTEVMLEASRHTGTSLIEIMQNCVIFNDKIHAPYTARETRDDNQIYLEHGKPMVFGKEKDKGIILSGTRLEVVNIGENGITENDLLVHDKYQWESGIHVFLATMEPPDYPVAMGVIRSINDFTYDGKMTQMIAEEKANNPIKTMDDLLNSGKTWEIEE